MMSATNNNNSNDRKKEMKKNERELFLPFSILFEKPQIISPKISSNGKFIVWLERTNNGILNFFFASSSSATSITNNSQKFQLSYFKDRDACLHYEIIQNDTLLFLRESQLGKEMYHLYTLPLPMTVLSTSGTKNDDGSSCWNSSTWKYTNHTLLYKDTIQTCCMGFVGTIQLWTTSSSTNNKVRFATGTGMAFIWDISELDVQTGQIHMVHHHPLSSSNKSKLLLILSYLQVLSGTLLHLLTSYIFLILLYFLSLFGWKDDNDGIIGIILKKYIVTKPVYIPIEWFLDSSTLNVCGYFAISIQIPLLQQQQQQQQQTDWSLKTLVPELHGSWNCRSTQTKNNNWIHLHTVSISNMNMHLIGSSPGKGTNRMDFDTNNNNNNMTVGVHLCHFNEHHSNFTCYVQFTISNDKVLKKEVSYSSSDSDITGFLINPKEQKVDAILLEHEQLYIQSLQQRNEDHGKDDYQRLQETILQLTQTQTKNHGCIFYPISRTNDNRYWIVYAYSENGFHPNNCQEAYFIYDNYHDQHYEQKQQEKSLQLWRNPRPSLTSNRLAKRFTFSIPIRTTQQQQQGVSDKILCFLSLPPILMTDKIPLCVVPHGGPNARDYWRYDPIVQLICTRGIAVLQVQFRGSTGFGMDFLRQGMNGGMFSTIQQDIIDAVHSLLMNNNNNNTTSGISIRRNKSTHQLFLHHYENPNNTNMSRDDDNSDVIHVDPSRIGILGGSFGGFCALFGITKLIEKKDLKLNPKFQYCCGIAISALYRVGAYASSSFRGDYLIQQYWKHVYGKDVSSNIKIAQSFSPYHYPHQVQVPTLLIHGDVDPRCPVQDARDFYSLVKNDNHNPDSNIQYLEYTGEGHGIRKESNILHLWDQVDLFLQTHLVQH